jgi:hypothetical protein
MPRLLALLPLGLLSCVGGSSLSEQERVELRLLAEDESAEGCVYPPRQLERPPLQGPPGPWEGVTCLDESTHLPVDCEVIIAQRLAAGEWPLPVLVDSRPLPPAANGPPVIDSPAPVPDPHAANQSDRQDVLPTERGM